MVPIRALMSPQLILGPQVLQRYNYRSVTVQSGPARGRSSGDALAAMEERGAGRAILDAARNAARLRIRAVLMTSFAFILGLMPLVIGSGAGEASQRGVGTAVFGGMLAASTVGIFLIPMLYVVFQRFRDKVHGGAAARGATQESAPPAAS